MSIPNTGRVASCESAETLAAVVAELLEDRHALERMGIAARNWVVDRFDWEAVIRDWRVALGEHVDVARSRVVA
jgi:glycosyltransferase involved in cell wall biosynthesis